MSSLIKLKITALPYRLVVVLVTVAATLGLFTYAVLLGAGLGSERMRIVLPLLFVPALLAGTALLSRRFVLMALLLPVTALVVPFELPTNTVSVINISLFLCLGLTATWALAILTRGMRLAPSPLNAPILTFGLVTIIATVWGFLWIDPFVARPFSFIVAQFASLLAILLSLSAALIVGNFYTTENSLKYLAGIYLFALFIMVICRFTGVLDAIQLPYYDDLTQFVINDRGLWALWLCAVAYGLLIAQPRLPWYGRLALLVVVVLTIYETLFNGSLWLSGWIPPLITMLAMTFVYSRWLFLVFCTVGIGLVLQNQNFFSVIFTNDLEGGSLERLILWERTLVIVRDHWLFGTGTAGYTLYFRSFYPYDLRSTHNGYFDILGQFGVVGLAVWFWLAGAIGIEALRLYNAARPGFLRTMVLIVGGGWVGALASMMLGDWVLPYTYNQTISGFKYTVHSWLFLGALISIRQIMTRQGLLDPLLGGQPTEGASQAADAGTLPAMSEVTEGSTAGRRRVECQP